MRIQAVIAVMLLPLLLDFSITLALKTKPKFRHEQEWNKWKFVHDRNYTNELEELERHLIWLSNKVYIDRHNANAHIFGFSLAMNHLGDLSEVDYMEKLTTKNALNTEFERQHVNRKVFQVPHNVTGYYPDSLDWRTKGAVGAVKNQLLSQCDSSYAFSAVGALEGARALSTGSFVALSEQNIVDCSVPYGNYGCSGGTVAKAFKYIIANDGINSQSSYPYVGRQNQCYYDTHYKGASMSGIVSIKSGDESSLLASLYSVGPVSVRVDGRSNAFRFYYGGVFDSSRCSSSVLTNSMLVTGYGTLNGKDYWLVKNSWGENWGAGGYILMTRNSYNQCGIVSDAKYPTL